MTPGSGSVRTAAARVAVFGVAMAYFESSVVVYLRAIAYPEGFTFPLSTIPRDIALTEIGREAASLIMIVSVACLAGSTRRRRFAFFLIIFGIWDIFYYVFLEVLLGWPSSLLTWDVLFLIPVIWSGPVLSPLLVSLVMLAAGWALIRRTPPGGGAKIMKPGQWRYFLCGAGIVFVSFIWDYTRFVASNAGGRFFSAAWELSTEYTPGSFPWAVFFIGLSLAAGGVIDIVLRDGHDGRGRTGVRTSRELRTRD
jgi:hypothetical protein